MNEEAATFRGLRNLAEATLPWLTNVGSWVFGGLTAVNLVRPLSRSPSLRASPRNQTQRSC
jgi:hypothetical protein